MNMQQVSSTNIESIGYDPETNCLFVRFHDGSLYRYSGVPEALYHGIMSAPSHGRYLNQHIKDRYPDQKIG